MQKITREQAIKMFERSISLESFNMPSYEYPNHLRRSGLERSVSAWNGNSQVIKFTEVLGGGNSTLSDSRKSKWIELFDDIFKDSDVVSNEGLADAIKAHAVKAYDSARGALDERIKPSGIFDRIANRLTGEPETLPSGEDVFAGLTVDVTYLPDDIFIPERILQLGDTVYQVYEDNRDVKIDEHMVTGRRLSKASKRVKKEGASCSCEFDYVTQNDTYDIKYTVKSSEKATPIHFELDDKGGFKGLITGDCFSPSGYFFLTRKAAEGRENKIWLDVESKLEAYRQRRKTPSPA